MAQTMVNFRMDEDLKKGMEQACKEMGLSMLLPCSQPKLVVKKEYRSRFQLTRSILKVI